MGKATEDLRKEHDEILHVLKILDRMMVSNAKQDVSKLRYYNELVYFLKIFADKCHHGKEENYLFKELTKKGIPDEGGPIGVMLQEHAQGRDYIALMSKSLESDDLKTFNDAAAGYQKLLRSHIEKENSIIFVMADKLLDVEKQDEIFEKFEKYEESVIGHGIHEELHSMINKWAAEF